MHSPASWLCTSLSPLLIKHGLDVISQPCLLHLPSIDYFLGAPPAARLTFPWRKQSPNVRRLSATQQYEMATSAHSHFTDRKKKKWKIWSEKLQRMIKIQHSNFTAPPLLRAACASLKLHCKCLPCPSPPPSLFYGNGAAFYLAHQLAERNPGSLMASCKFIIN